MGALRTAGTLGTRQALWSEAALGTLHTLRPRRAVGAWSPSNAGRQALLNNDGFLDASQVPHRALEPSYPVLKRQPALPQRLLFLRVAAPQRLPR